MNKHVVIVDGKDNLFPFICRRFLESLQNHMHVQKFKVLMQDNPILLIEGSALFIFTRKLKMFIRLFIKRKKYAYIYMQSINSFVIIIK